MQGIHRTGSRFVKPGQHDSEVGFGHAVMEGTGDEVVVIGEDGPCIQLPAMIARVGKESIVKQIERCRFAKDVLLFAGAGRDKIRPVQPQSVRRRMGPFDDANHWLDRLRY